MGDSQKTAVVKVVVVKEDLGGKRELVELVEVQTAMGMCPQSASKTTRGPLSPTGVALKHVLHNLRSTSFSPAFPGSGDSAQTDRLFTEDGLPTVGPVLTRLTPLLAGSTARDLL